MSESTAFNLSAAIFDRIEELGTQEAAKLFKVKPTVIQKWAGGTILPDVRAAQIVLDEALVKGLTMPVFSKSAEQGETTPEVSLDETAMPKPKRTTTEGPKAKEVDPVAAMQKARKYSILCPINREMSYATVLSMLGNWKATLPEPIRDMLAHIDFEPDTTPHMARNRLATRFLESQDEWSFWMDSDIIAPIGNPAWFKRRTGTKHGDQWAARAAIDRLTSRNKSFVGAVYSQRSAARSILASPGTNPQNEGEKLTAQEIREKGPVDKVVEVNWIGFGCVAVHRSVFEAVLKLPGVQSTIKGQAHEFFTPIAGGNEGEDMAFCKRARQAGHPPFLDMSIHCGHIGKFCFLP